MSRDATEQCRLGLEPARHSDLHPHLDRWRANVGTPIAFDATTPAAAALEAVDVLCWNVAIGLGRLEEVLERLRLPAAGALGTRAERPLVLLLQEAYRTDETVPPVTASEHHGGAVAARERASIEQVARAQGLSLRYSPSMRNGAHASDRGNAILATVALTNARAVLLPYVRQRRVVVTAQLAGHPELSFASVHLDTHGRIQGAPSSRRPGSGRAAQAAALGAHLAAERGSVVLGGDLNSALGMTDPAVRTLVASGLHPARRSGRWRHTFHARLRLLLDHVLFRGPRIEHIDVTRLDEVPGDRSRRVFGSDHHPLLAHVQLRP